MTEPTRDLGQPLPPDRFALGPQCAVCLEVAVDAVRIGGIAAATGPGYAAYACAMCAIEEGIRVLGGLD